MAKPTVNNESWEVLVPRLPEDLPIPEGARSCVDDRVMLTGLPFMLKSGLPVKSDAYAIAGQAVRFACSPIELRAVPE